MTCAGQASTVPPQEHANNRDACCASLASNLQKQWSASKYRVLLWRWTHVPSPRSSRSLSSMGLALIPVVPRSGTATVPLRRPRRSRPHQSQAETKLEVALAQREAAAALRIAREAAAAADSGKPIATEQDDSLLQLAAAKRRARQVKREEESEPTRNPSAIATEEPARKPSSIASEPGKVPVPDAKPSGRGQDRDGRRARAAQARRVVRRRGDRRAEGVRAPARPDRRRYRGRASPSSRSSAARRHR